MLPLYKEGEAQRPFTVRHHGTSISPEDFSSAKLKTHSFIRERVEYTGYNVSVSMLSIPLNAG